MTSSVERKQYDWRVEPERSFFNNASVERSDTLHVRISENRSYPHEKEDSTREKLHLDVLTNKQPTQCNYI